MTLVQISMEYDEQERDATMQLLFNKIVKGGQSLQRGGPDLSKYAALREYLSIEHVCTVYLSRFLILHSLRKL